ncbi:exosortase/archaeosortase family protein [Marinobacter sp.]|uniref:exosortase/archaeosortase family protein n=1 Tax=Marinobacter sp. TaxID=50741 RepID=UPI003A904A64
MNREGILGRGVVRQLLPYLVMLFGVGLLVLPTLEGVVSRWLKLDESYSHGFLLLAVSVFLTVQAVKRHPIVAGFYPFWLVPLCLCLLGYWLGGLIRLQALQQLTLVPMLLSALAVLMGWRQVRWLIIPVGLLFFTIPVWDFLSWNLQLITVAVNKFLLGLLDIDFEVEGVFVYLIGVGTFEVAHGCSGLRYLLVGQALVLIYGELYLSRVRSRVLLFCCGVAFALVANWIRVFVIIYMGYETNMQSSLIEDHDNFGWWVFAATLVPLYFIARRLELQDEKCQSNTSTETTFVQERKAVGVSLGVVLLCVGVTYAALPDKRSSVLDQPKSYGIDIQERYAPVFGAQLAGWRPQIQNPDWAYAQTLFDRQQISTDGSLDEQFYLGVFTYEFQRHRAELVQYTNRLYDTNLWVPEQFYKVPSKLNIPIQGITLKSLATGEKIHIAYSYMVEGRWETDQWRAKLAQVLGFFSERSDASLLIAAVRCGDCTPQESLLNFVETTFPQSVSSINQEVAGLSD